MKRGYRLIYVSDKEHADRFEGIGSDVLYAEDSKLVNAVKMIRSEWIHGDYELDDQDEMRRLDYYIPQSGNGFTKVISNLYSRTYLETISVIFVSSDLSILRSYVDHFGLPFNEESVEK